MKAETEKKRQKAEEEMEQKYLLCRDPSSLPFLPSFFWLFGVVWCSLAQFGAKKLLLFFCDPLFFDGVKLRLHEMGRSENPFSFAAAALQLGK